MAEPAPARPAALAARLERPGSVAAALRRLPLPCLQAAEALVALGGPARREELATLLGALDGERAKGLDTALLALTTHALVWPDGDGRLHHTAPLRQIWPTPLGLESPVAELLADATSEELRSMLALLGIRVPVAKQQRLDALLERFASTSWLASVVAQAPPGARQLLEEWARTGATPAALLGSATGEVGRAARWARERGLLIRAHHGYGPGRVPAEVTLALRGPSWHAPFEPVPPPPELVRVTAAEVERETVAAATLFSTRAGAVLAECAAQPPALLKSGGVGPRELGRIGKAADCPDPIVRLVLECAFAAGLLTASNGILRSGRTTANARTTSSRSSTTQAAAGGPPDGLTAMTPAYDAWLEQEPARQLVDLTLAWWTLPFTPTATHDQDGKAWPALISRPPSPSCRQSRRGLLNAAGRLPADRGAAHSAGLGRLTAWHRPMAERLAQESEPFATVIREAELLGVIARGALSPFGAALSAHSPEQPDALLECARRLLPAAADRARLGTDLTAVVTGPPSGRLAALLDSAADRESRGTATVWRFSAAGIRRALDAGRTPEALAADLAAITVPASKAAGEAGGRLPQPLAYLIRDTARRHGRIRVATPGCVLHGPDPVLLAEVAAHRGLAPLGLRLLAPTVLVSAAGPQTALDSLRAAGYAPVAESADGTIRLERSTSHRAPLVPPQRHAPAQPLRALPSPAELRALAGRLLTAAADDARQDADPVDPDTEDLLADDAAHLDPTEIRRLARAIQADRTVTIEYLAPSGNRTVRTLSELEFDPPYLHAWCHLREDQRIFTLARIQAVLPG